MKDCDLNEDLQKWDCYNHSLISPTLGYLAFSPPSAKLSPITTSNATKFHTTKFYSSYFSTFCKISLIEISQKNNHFLLVMIFVILY